MGQLFEEGLPLASFDSEMREMILMTCSLDWSKISPAIFWFYVSGSYES
jgi:hypothetical protein